MKLPNVDQALVPPEKIKDYLLNVAHEKGRGKAIFLLHFGFSVAKWEELVQSLIRHAHDHEVAKSEVSRFGTRYVLEGGLQTPSGRTPQVRVVWFVPEFGDRPRLVTVYPLEEHDD